MNRSSRIAHPCQSAKRELKEISSSEVGWGACLLGALQPHAQSRRFETRGDPGDDRRDWLQWSEIRDRASRGSHSKRAVLKLRRTARTLLQSMRIDRRQESRAADFQRKRSATRRHEADGY